LPEEASQQCESTMSLKIDLHVHSESHGKPFLGENELHEAIRCNGLDGIAVTNFFDLAHAQWLQKRLTDCIIIVGQEVWTREGHLLGIGIQETIPDSISVEETIALIHDQGGIAIVPHPFLFLGIGGKMAFLQADAIETYNGLIGMSFIFNYLAKRMARELNFPQTASTDTTDPRYVGWSYTEVLTDKVEEILHAIALGQVRLHKKALPVPLKFILKSLFYFRNIEPSPLHAVPCFICGKSMVTRFFKTKHICADCGTEEISRISCCNGHFFCTECILTRGAILAKMYKFYKKELK